MREGTIGRLPDHPRHRAARIIHPGSTVCRITSICINRTSEHQAFVRPRTVRNKYLHSGVTERMAFVRSVESISHNVFRKKHKRDTADSSVCSEEFLRN